MTNTKPKNTLALRLHKLVENARRVCAPKRAQALPPPLPLPYGSQEYEAFMRSETRLFSPAYARRNVRIHGEKHLHGCAGGVLVFLHYGSFFLSGGALVHQHGLSYTAIASRRNLARLPAEEAAFWFGVHQRSAALYGARLFYSDEPAIRMIQWLSQGRFLGAALDVREVGHKQRSAQFDFLGARLHFHTGPGRLAVITGRPMLPMTIRYDPDARRHDLFIGPVIRGRQATSLIQAALDAMAPIVEADLNQFFHDLFTIFARPHEA